jgi:hypothetical protein
VFSQERLEDMGDEVGLAERASKVHLSTPAVELYQEEDEPIPNAVRKRETEAGNASVEQCPKALRGEGLGPGRHARRLSRRPRVTPGIRLASLTAISLVFSIAYINCRVDTQKLAILGARAEEPVLPVSAT